MENLDRPLPTNPDAEWACVGSCLLDAAALDVACGIVKPESFADERLGIVFGAMYAMHDAHLPIDATLLREELTRRGVFDSIGGFATLGRAGGSVPSALRVRHYAELVQAAHRRRMLIGALHRANEAAFDPELDSHAALAFAETAVLNVTESRIKTEPQGWNAMARDTYESLMQVDSRNNDVTGIASGYPELDGRTCGFQPGELVIVAARPSMGKTALGLNMGAYMARSGVAVLFFSLEMSNQQLARRVLSSESGVDGHDIRRHSLTAQDRAAIAAAHERMNGTTFIVDESGHLTVRDLRASARIMQRRHGIQIMFVDYLQLMGSDGRYEKRYEAIGAMTRGLKLLAIELKVPVIAMCQLNREAATKRPQLHELRESGNIEQDADLVLLIHRDDKEPPENVTLILAKNRNGPIGDVKLFWEARCTRFVTAAPGWHP